ncbi:MAG: substrate-binding domain-containing protein [Acidimicrobiales bacterium]
MSLSSLERTAVCVLLAAALAGCATTPPASGPVERGTADVVYAGSLVGLVQSKLQPGFEKATGDSFVGKGAGSLSLAEGILDGELSPGAFVSVGAKPIERLWPSRSKFSISLATDPLVVAFASTSRYAAQLQEISSGKAPLSQLFSLFERPGFRIGRTDPNADPQGQFFILMCKLAESELGLPKATADKVLGITASKPSGSASQIFDETALDPQISAGNVDAGSAYLSQALQYHLDYIVLPAGLNFAVPAKVGVYKKASLRLTNGTVVTGGLITLDDTLVLPATGSTRSTADERADEAWLSFLLSRTGRSLLEHSGYSLTTPELSLVHPGAVGTEVPPSVRSALIRAGGRTATP